MNGKGSKRRPTNEDVYRSSWERIFAGQPDGLEDDAASDNEEHRTPEWPAKAN